MGIPPSASTLMFSEPPVDDPAVGASGGASAGVGVKMSLSLAPGIGAG